MDERWSFYRAATRLSLATRAANGPEGCRSVRKASRLALAAHHGRGPRRQAARARGDREEDCPFHNGPVGAEQRAYWLAGFRGEKCPTEDEVTRFVKTGSTSKTSELSQAHHDEAKNWDDRQVCLEMAAENEWTVKEMIAWRNIQKAAL